MQFNSGGDGAWVVKCALVCSNRKHMGIFIVAPYFTYEADDGLSNIHPMVCYTYMLNVCALWCYTMWLSHRTFYIVRKLQECKTSEEMEECSTFLFSWLLT